MLLIATLATSGVMPVTVALGLVLGANIGSGVLAHARHRQRHAAGAAAAARQPDLQAARRASSSSSSCRRCTSLLQQLLPVGAPAGRRLPPRLQHRRWRVLFIGFTGAGRPHRRPLAGRPARRRRRASRPRHLDPLALDMPSLAISCAAREALHQADVVETMLRGILPVIRNNDLRARRAAAQARRHGRRALLGDQVLPDADLAARRCPKDESRRWTDIVSFTINMEQIGDIIERVLQDIEDKKVRKKRAASPRPAWPRSCHLHERLLANLRLAMSVFLDGHVRDAQAAARGEGALPRPRARVRRQPHRAAARQHRAEHRDQLAAPRPDQRPEADQLAHLRRSPTRSSNRPAR